MLERFFAWIGKANVAIDLGNLSVGIATLTLALVTISIARRSSKRDANSKIAELRHGWINELRGNFVRLNTTSFEILILCGRSKAGERISFASDEKFSSLFVTFLREQSEILLRLNPKEETNRDLAKKLAAFYNLHAKLEDYRLISVEDRQSRLKTIVKERRSIMDLQRSVLKKEWDRLRGEIHGDRSLKFPRGRKTLGIRNKPNETWWEEETLSPKLSKEE